MDGSGGLQKLTLQLVDARAECSTRTCIWDHPNLHTVQCSDVRVLHHLRLNLLNLFRTKLTRPSWPIRKRPGALRASGGGCSAASRLTPRSHNPNAWLASIQRHEASQLPLSSHSTSRIPR